MLGEEVLSSKLVSNKLEEVVDVSNLKNGIYFIEIKTEQGVTRKKFIKE